MPDLPFDLEATLARWRASPEHAGFRALRRGDAAPLGGVGAFCARLMAEVGGSPLAWPLPGVRAALAGWSAMAERLHGPSVRDDAIAEAGWFWRHIGRLHRRPDLVAIGDDLIRRPPRLRRPLPGLYRTPAPAPDPREPADAEGRRAGGAPAAPAACWMAG